MARSLQGLLHSLQTRACTLDGQMATCCWKRASGADSGSYTFGGSPGEILIGLCQAYRLQRTRYHQSAGPSTLKRSIRRQSLHYTINANGVTAVAGDDLLWLSAPDATVTGGVTGHTPPTSYTEQQDADKRVGIRTSGATQDNVSAGATGTVAGASRFPAVLRDMAVLVRIPAAASGLTVGEMMAACQRGQINPVMEKIEIVGY
jgi:hypothetical protein